MGTAEDSTLTPFEAAVVAVLDATEPGDVLAYGEVAAEAGFPGAARAIGGVLQRVDGLPWWRVVAASGRLVPHNAAEQARRLAAEGVVTVDGRVRFPTERPDADRPRGPIPDRAPGRP
jgi:methylated-DNA-protein-cysteine methyltransferase-like protein